MYKYLQAKDEVEFLDAHDAYVWLELLGNYNQEGPNLGKAF